MASDNKYEIFVGDLTGKVHDLLGTAGSTADTCKVGYSNTAPNAGTHATFSQVTEISAGNGYTAGGASAANVGTRSAGTFTLVCTDIVTTASGSVGPFRYVIFYNDTPTSPADPLISWWDYGSALTLANGETFTVDFGASTFTLA